MGRPLNTPFEGPRKCGEKSMFSDGKRPTNPPIPLANCRMLPGRLRCLLATNSELRPFHPCRLISPTVSPPFRDTNASGCPAGGRAGGHVEGFNPLTRLPPDHAIPRPLPPVPRATLSAGPDNPLRRERPGGHATGGLATGTWNRHYWRLKWTRALARSRSDRCWT